MFVCNPQRQMDPAQTTMAEQQYDRVAFSNHADRFASLGGAPEIGMSRSARALLAEADAEFSGERYVLMPGLRRAGETIENMVAVVESLVCEPRGSPRVLLMGRSARDVHRDFDQRLCALAETMPACYRRQVDLLRIPFVYFTAAAVASEVLFFGCSEPISEWGENGELVFESTYPCSVPVTEDNVFYPLCHLLSAVAVRRMIYGEFSPSQISMDDAREFREQGLPEDRPANFFDYHRVLLQKATELYMQVFK